MELGQLSSNWKKLQATLQAAPKPTSKRKATSEPHPPLDRSKRLKPNSRHRENGRRTTTNKREASRNGISPDGPEEQESEPGNTRIAALPAERVNEGRAQDVPAGRYIALDCEMVGVGPQPSRASALARVSIVDYRGAQLYDSFVRPKEAVTDYRSGVSGVTAELLRGGARPFERVQRDAAELMLGRVLVGHAVRHDLDALMLGHPRRDIRDTSRHPPYRALAGGRSPALRRLARDLLGLEIQGGAHSSVEDARAAMALFRREKGAFEREHAKLWGIGKIPGKPTKGGAGQEDDGGKHKAKAKSRKKKKKKKKKKARK